MITATTNRVSGRNIFDFSLDDGDISEEGYDRNNIKIENEDKVMINFIDKTAAGNSWRANLLFLVVDDIAKGVEVSIINQLNLQLYATIVTATTRKCADLYSDVKKEYIVICNIELKSENLYSSFINSVVTLCEPSLCVMLDGYSISSICSQHDFDLGTISVLKTEAATPEHFADTSLFSYLDVGLIVTGLTASILCYCEARNIAAVCYFSIRETCFTISAAKAFERIWPNIQKHFGNRSIKVPGKSLYNIALRADKFMSVSENLY